MAKIRLSASITLTIIVLFLPPDSSEALDCWLVSLKDESICIGEDDIDSDETFASPESFPDSLFGKRTYGKLADNAFVYPEPSGDVPPVRNVGDGFLYATISSWQEVGGETWYQINDREYVHEDDIRPIAASDF